MRRRISTEPAEMRAQDPLLDDVSRRGSDSSSRSTSTQNLLKSMLDAPGASTSLVDDITPPEETHSQQHTSTQDSPRRRPRSGSTAEEQILNVVDQIEDDWDEHTYEDLVPLEIKLAIEQNVFGWSHLTSDIAGHIFFTVGAFAFVYLILWEINPSQSLMWLRYLASTIAALSSFRMVRRRRKVWLRAPYGSRKYRKDAARRLKEVAEADKTSWLGRIRRQRRQRKVEKQLRRAESDFEQHHERKANQQSSIMMPLTYQDGGMAMTTADDLYQSPRTPPRKRQRRPSFRTEAVNVMQSVQHDQILFAKGPIHRMIYSHGGFFGAAPFMLNNPHWISILRQLMPDVYVEISRRVKAPPYKLIHWAENNPVVAAYGSAQELESSGKFPGIEWDIFLDPYLVKCVSVVLTEREKFLQSISPLGFRANDSGPLRPFENITLPDNLTSSQRGIWHYYNTQLKKRVRWLVDEMLIAHGNLTQLALEQTGWAKQYNYSRVRRTRRTLGGGIYAKQWMAVYAESLRIGVLEESPNNSPGEDTRANGTKTTLNALTDTPCPDTTIAESVSIVKSIVKGDHPFRLVLDVKSRHVPKQVWACVVDTLREDGVIVEGIASFFIDDIRWTTKYTSSPVKEMLFFHSAGDLQQACHSGRIHRGDCVFFNAGSLIYSSNESRMFPTQSYYSPDNIKNSYRFYPFAQTSINPNVDSSHSTDDTSSSSSSFLTSSVSIGSTIEQYKNYYELSIGLYVQEFAIDEAACNLLVEYANRNQHVYDLGLSWGGVNGITIRGIQPDRFTLTDGFWNQRYIGAKFDPSLGPPLLDERARRATID